MSREFESLVREHKDAVYRQMVRVCGNYDDAEDVLSEALLSAYKSLDTLRDDEAFRGWLAIIGRRVCGRIRKKEALQPLVELTELNSPSVSPELDLESEEMGRKIKEIVNSLPDGTREVYVMRDIEELSGEEVAEKLGISLAAMKSRLHRARGLVRQAIDECVDCADLASN